uniref:Protein Dr1 n=1 Tax=Anopheles stephensi TaxID=30069 RepID=A0A182YE03_ANOST
MSDPHDELCPPNQEDDELTLPRASINKIIKELDYKQEAEAVLNDCKQVAAKRRRQSTRLENLGIPEEELLRQQQELFARAREEQAAAEQQQWYSVQTATLQNAELFQKQMSQDEDDSDEY